MADDIANSFQDTTQEVFNLRSFQEIVLIGDDLNNVHTINGKETLVTIGTSYHNSGSSQIKINNIVDYSWEKKYHFGRLVATTANGSHIAYSLTGVKSPSGIVRVLNRLQPTVEQRILIKGFRGKVKDLSFSCTKDVILACIDEYGTLHIVEIHDSPDFCYRTLLHLECSESVPSDFHLLFWCPYIPDDPNEVKPSGIDFTEDTSLLLAFTHDKQVEVINVKYLSKKYGNNPFLLEAIPSSTRMIIDHNENVTIATFSPDGTAVATGSKDGEIHFFEVSYEARGQPPNCLHHWKPHNGRPVSSLFFLDNHRNHEPDVQFWKFALTGVDFNQELKLWSCESWDCLQTMKFGRRGVSDGSPSMMFRAELDASSQYLLLSDILNKSVYVLQIYQNMQEASVQICSIAEFPVANPVLSLSIVHALKCNVKITDEVEPTEKNGNDQNGNEHEEDDDCLQIIRKGITIKCFWINVKSLQECRITYHPPMIINSDETISMTSHESLKYHERLSNNLDDLSNTSILDKKDSSGALIMSSSLVSPLVSSSLVSTTVGSPMLSPLVMTSNSTVMETSTPNRHKAATLPEKHEVLLQPEDFESPSQTLKKSMLSGSLNPNLTPSSVPLPPITPSEESALKNKSIHMGSIFKELHNLSPQSLSMNQNMECLSLNPDSDALPLSGSDSLPLNILSNRKSSQRSSTSSPSQEVEDIFRPTKSITQGKNEELVDLSLPAIPTSLYLNDMSSETASNLNGLPLPLSSCSPPAYKKDANSHSDYKPWPQAPDLSKSYRVIGQNFASNSLPLKASPAGDSLYQMREIDQEVKDGILKIEKSLDLLNNSLAQKRQDEQEVIRRIERLEKDIPQLLARSILQQSQADYNKIESLISRKQEMDRHWLEKHATEAAQSASNVVSNRLDKSIKQEMKTQVLPNHSRLMEGWKDQMQLELQQRLTASDSAMKEGIKLAIKNKSFNDSIAQSVSFNIQGLCKDLLDQHMLPTVEKFCQNLFLQLNESFKLGTKEYLQQTEKFVERSIQQTQSQIGDRFQRQLMDQEAKRVAANHAFLESLKANVASTIKGALTELNSSLSVNLRTIVAEEVNKAIKEQTPAMNERMTPRMQTPLPETIDRTQILLQMKNYIETGQFNNAFVVALNSRDNQMLETVLEAVHISKVFRPDGCAVTQRVMLNLVNYISMSMGRKTDLKLSYLEECVINIDPTDVSLTKAEVSNMIENLNNKLNQFKQDPKNAEYHRKIRVLNMAIKNLNSSS